MHLILYEWRWKGNQVRILSDPVTVSREQPVRVHCMSASIWEGTALWWSPSQETCSDCIRLKLPSKVSIHTCLWDMECLISNEQFTCREPWTGFMHCIKRQGEFFGWRIFCYYHGTILRKQVLWYFRLQNTDSPKRFARFFYTKSYNVTFLPITGRFLLLQKGYP